MIINLITQVVLPRVWFSLLILGYVFQVFTLTIFPIAFLAWLLGLSDNYIEDYVNYTKRVLTTKPTKLSRTN